MTVINVAIPNSMEASGNFLRSSWNQRTVVLLCNWMESGVVWRGLKPLLLDSRKRLGRRAVACLFKVVTLRIATRTDASAEEFKDVLPLKDSHSMRRLVVREAAGLPRSLRRSFVLYILPPNTTYYDTTFTGSLIAWEHQMILYQSMAAWISTLGGGHFFCRHLSTAMALAKQQRRIAILMGDLTMAYKCTINEAYSYIYAGKFDAALKTINSVAILNRRLDIHPLDTVIVNMCSSARLFCKRVRKASKKLHSSKTQQQASTRDDYQRIRVVEENTVRKERV